MTNTCAAALLALLLSAAPSLAHGLLMKLAGDGAQIVGELYYSNGHKAAGEWIEVVDLADPGAPAVTLQTGPDGGFRAAGAPGRTYRVTATGEEGHTVAMELTLGGAAKPKLAGEAAASEAASQGPPAWLLIGGFLLLSIIPALWLKRRAPGAAARRGDLVAPSPQLARIEVRRPGSAYALTDASTESS